MPAEQVGKAIAFLRRRVGLTQKGLAQKLAISDKAVSKWERGLGMPDISILRSLCSVLDIDMDTLLAGEVIHKSSDWKGMLFFEERSEITPTTMVFDKPIVYRLLSNFLLVGINNITVFCSQTEVNRIRSFIGEGWDYGMNLSYYTGSPIEYERESNHGNEKVMLQAGGGLLVGAGLTSTFQRAMGHNGALTSMSIPMGGERNEISLRYELRNVDIPIYFGKTQELLPVLSGQHMVSQYQESFLRGTVYVPYTSWDSIANASELIRLYEKVTATKLNDLREICWRRGLTGTAATK